MMTSQPLFENNATHIVYYMEKTNIHHHRHTNKVKSENNTRIYLVRSKIAFCVLKNVLHRWKPKFV